MCQHPTFLSLAFSPTPDYASTVTKGFGCKHASSSWIENPRGAAAAKCALHRSAPLAGWKGNRAHRKRIQIMAEHPSWSHAVDGSHPHLPRSCPLLQGHLFHAESRGTPEIDGY